MLDALPATRLDAAQHDSAGSLASPRMAASDVPRWFCVATLSNLDHMAKAGLAATGFEIFFPQIIQRTKIRSLFPGYGFVRFTPATDPWFRITDVPGVYRLFTHGPESPTPLPCGAVEAIQAAADASGVVHPPHAPSVRPGAVCRLLDGPMVNLTGVCAWSQGDRIRLLMNLLGGQATISVQASSVEVIG